MSETQEIKVILASGSPRRKELLQMIVPEFEVVVSDCEEIITKKEPKEVTKELALQKAMAVAKEVDEPNKVVIIGSDTVVSAKGEILGKPLDKEDARRMIHMLSGDSHMVSTGVALVYKENGKITQMKQFAETTLVYVSKMSEEEIEEYLATSEPYDKAGSYAVQGLFGKFISRIEGDYNTVVGLPVNRLYQELKS